MRVSFNKVWVKTKTKAEFKKAFSSIYPDLDLDAAYDEIVPPKKKKTQEESK